MGTNTGLGIGIGIPFKNNALGGDKPYFPPELKARMIGVWTNYGKKNTDTDRNIIKNKIPNAGGDLEILNAAYKLNSGFGEYSEDFTTWTKSSKITSVDSESFDFVTNVNWNLLYYKSNIGKDIPSFKVRIKLKGESKVFYNYITSEGVYTNEAITSEEYVTPISYNTKYTGETPVNCGFSIGITSEEGSGTITQIPNFEDAFVTDGINDMIVSQKTLQEMGVTKELTIVSMIHQISWRDSASVPLTNYIRPSSNNYVRSHVSNIGKTGIYGYVCYDISNSGAGNSHVVNTILGDKNDYSINIVGDLSQGKFSVQGYMDGNGNILETSSVAHYWTFAVLGKATEDEINLIIGNYNLDRSLKPDILCNIGKQGITNENHAEFNDKLIDFSGNGRDIQLNNLAWDGDSGIGKYNYPNWKVTATIANTYSTIVNYPTVNGTYSINVNGVSELMQSIGLPLEIKYTTSTGIIYKDIKQDGVYSYILPDGATDLTLRFGGIPGIVNEPCNITITQIPSHAGGLCLDGVNDFGKVTGMPIYKDYTVVTDREIFAYIGAISSKNNPGAFLETAGNSVYSFGQGTSGLNFISTRSISYLSKYSYCGQSITAGAAKDGTDMWLGTIRDNDSRFFKGAIYSLMSFPYSMSKFLIERQLKKHKLGTLYPDMVEFRPIVKSNSEYKVVNCYIDTLPAVVGNYYLINSKLRIAVTTKGAADEVTSLTVNGVSLGTPSVKGNRFTFDGTLSDKSPQKINVTIDEYIRYEDIVQPYPVLLRFKDESGKEVSYGDKIKVGSSITRIGSFNDCNLLKGIYTVSNAKLNGSPLPSTPHVVERQMVFTCTATYLLDNNEPKCILSPRLLRIPNSSYKILGYIPDISGHGNNGVIHNSAYAEGSGVNEDGSYQLDGVDDFVTIPTLSSGGKQVLMKVNSRKSDCYLYDQRNNWTQYLGIVSTKDFIAYNYSNQRGKTYIDGILNENITANDLIGITHNITLTNNRDDVKQYSPCIGTSFARNSYAQMALYDFMLFDDISTDDKIKQLNEYVGIEAKVELPPYYWDAYGKTNLDADKATIQQRGVAVGDYDLTNYNHAYEGMSGYNGYPVVFGANKTWTNKSNGYVTSITSNTIHITNVLNAGLALLYSYVKYNGNLQNIKEIPPFKIEIKGLEGKSKFIYKYLATSDATKETNLYLRNGTHELPKSFLPTEALVNDAVVGFSISPIEEGVTNFLSDITIEVLPEYENGLAYDGVSDFTDNKNIPILTDFTFIIKREILGLETNESMLVIKGDKVYNNGIGNAFILEHNSNGVNYIYSYGKLNQIKRDDSKIIYLTPESYNGNPIIKGENGDNLGLVLSKHWRGIIYKTILYSKTMSLLEINFLKNLMERDEIIDLNNPIFIQE